MFLEVRTGNDAGIALYQHNGFKMIGERPGYYTAGDGREDAIVRTDQEAIRHANGQRFPVSPHARVHHHAMNRAPSR